MMTINVKRLDYTSLVRSRRDILLALLIALATIGMYWQATSFAFVNYDDHRYVYENPRVLEGLTRDNFAWAFSTFEFSNWHPLTWLSLMLDASIFSPTTNARGYHITNVVLHALNAALAMLLLFGLTGALWRSALVAMLFALHPLHVESVAWISERKDVLSTCFGLMAMLAYLRFARDRDASEHDLPRPRRSRPRTAYLMTLLCFVFSVMSKPMLVTLPLVLLLLDWWPLQRARSSHDWTGLLIEKIPMAAISIASCVLTIMAQSASGAMRDLQHLSITQRLSNAFFAYSEYLRQTIWPADLAVFYPLPSNGGWPTAQVAAAAITLVIITLACAIAARRNVRAPLVGWLWFLGTLIPVIGLVQVGGQAHADRYTYFPLVGVFIVVAWTLPSSPPAALRLSIIGAASSLIALAAVCWFQIGYWRDSTTLALRALDVTDNNYMAHILLGNALVDAGKYEEAAAHLQEATRIEPTLPQAWHNLGFAMAQLGMNEEAMQAYRTAIAQRPDFAENHFNLGLLLQAAGRIDEAREALGRAAELAHHAGDEGLASRANDAIAKLPAQ